MPLEPSAAVLEPAGSTEPSEDAALTDGQLLELFVRQHSQAALARLIRRHSRMVWGVCRRVLRRQQDAEDAFQAVFMVLTRKAAAIQDPERVGAWLYGVARQSAVRLRSSVARSNNREGPLQAIPEPAAPAADGECDWRLILDQELSGLPEHYRTLIVLCDLEAETRTAVARRLGIPAGTVAGRLFRARALLKERLTRRGVVVSGALSATAFLPQFASASAPSARSAAVIESATALAAEQAANVARSSVVATAVKSFLTTWTVTQNKVAIVLLTAALAAASWSTGLSPDKSSQASVSSPPESQPARNPPCRVLTQNNCSACHAGPKQFAPHFQPAARGMSLAAAISPAPRSALKSVN